MPMVSAGHSFFGIQTLLHHNPLLIGSQNEAVKVNLKTIADSVIVNAGCKTALAHQSFTVESPTTSNEPYFRGGIASKSSATAANKDPQFAVTWRQASFERGHNRSCDAGGMPVHSHD